MQTNRHTNMMISSFRKPLFSLAFIFLFSFTSAAFAGDAKLFGHWKGGGIDINLKSNHTFTYKVKIVKTFNFSGKWSASKNRIVMTYKVAGIKQKKTASYRFKGKKLLLKMKGKGEATLTKQ